NHDATGSDGTPVRLTGDSAATGSQHNAAALGQLIDHRFLAPPESFLPFHVKNPRNIRAGTRFNFMVGVDEFVIQDLGKLTPDGAFSSTHRANQNNVGTSLHRLLLLS